MAIATSATPWLDSADWRGHIFSGTWKSGGAGTVSVTNKANGQILGEIGIASAADVAAACKSAAKAQPAWAATARAERERIIRRAQDVMNEHAEEIVWWLVREGGGTVPKAQFEVFLTAGKFAVVADERRDGAFEETVKEDADIRSVAQRVPLGVVGVISPFNFPLYLAMRAVIPALAFGNAVVLKPDEQTAVGCGIAIARVFAEAGLPDGLLHVLPGDVEPGEALTHDANVHMIAFTGSSDVGRKVGAAAGAGLKRVSLELGGNSPFIVLDDADLELAASNGAWGSFLHQGQICMASSRHLVHKDVAEKYAALLAEHAARLPVGDPAENPNVALGPIINATQVKRVDRIVQETVAAGATLLTGGTHEGPFYRPTVLSGVTPSMAAFREEIFGPVAPITTFATDEEAIELANATEYGLSAGIVSRSLERARKIANALHTGIVHINDQTVDDDAHAPFGGVGASGNGSRHGGRASLDEFTTWRWYTERKTPPQYPF
jgi:benzaldehyde dehydrogenase (NAD)